MASIQATFYTFEKRDNSTKKPSDGGTTLSVTFKEETDILNPRLEVRYSGAFGFNYVYLDFTNRYYKITQATSIAHDTYYLECTHDVLANWIDDAKGQSVYAEYSSYDFNLWLDDTRISAGHNVITTKGDPVTPEVFRTPDGNGKMPYTYVLAAIVENEYVPQTEVGKIGGIEYMFGEAIGFQTLLSKFANLDFVESLKSGSPWDAICAVYAVPFDIGECVDTAGLTLRYLWGIEFTSSGSISNCIVKHYTRRVYFPRPSNNDFRFSERFVKYQLNIPYCGVIDVPTSLVLSSQQLSGNYGYAECTYAADPISGEFACEVKVNKVSLGQYGANMKIDLPLGGRQSQGSFMARQGGVAAIGAIGAMVAGGAPLLAASTLSAGAIAGGVGLAKAAIDIPPINTFGSYGGNGCLAQFNRSIGDFFAVMTECDSDINPATLSNIVGRPTMKVTTIQNGYIKTSGASVSLGALAEEVTAFNNLLNGGVYVE